MRTWRMIIDVAKAEVGHHEGRTNGHWNNDQKYSKEVPGLEWSNRQPWCATFVSWCAMKSGLGSLYPRTASCDVGGQWFKSQGRWSEYPAVGAQVFLGYPNDLNHTGIVTSFNDKYIWTVEGNTNDSGSREGDGVYVRQRERASSSIIGYGYPRFPEGIISADPKWAGDAPRRSRKKERPNVKAILRLAQRGAASNGPLTKAGKAFREVERLMKPFA